MPVSFLALPRLLLFVAETITGAFYRYQQHVAPYNQGKTSMVSAHFGAPGWLDWYLKKEKKQLNTRFMFPQILSNWYFRI